MHTKVPTSGAKTTTQGAAPKRRTSTNPKGPERSLLALPTSDAERIAKSGVSGTSSSLPFLDRIQTSFGSAHDLSNVSAHVGDRATGASKALGARAYAFGDHVAFAKAPTLKLAAHEAAHVVQQRGDAPLNGDNRDERFANLVADRVVNNRSASDLLGRPSSNQAHRQIVQRDVDDEPTANDLRDEFVVWAQNQYQSAKSFPERSAALRLVLLLQRDKVTLDVVDDFDGLMEESKKTAASEDDTWGLLSADGKSDDFMIEHGEAFPNRLADRIYALGHVRGSGAINTLWDVRNEKVRRAQSLGREMETEIWDGGLPVSSEQAASMTEDNLDGLALSLKQLDAPSDEAITQYTRSLLDWERTESHFYLVSSHESMLTNRVDSVRKGSTIVDTKEYASLTANAFFKQQLALFDVAAAAPGDHQKALRALLMFHPDRNVRFTRYRWTQQELAPFEVAIDNIDKKLGAAARYERMWRALVWAHERSYLSKKALEAFAAIYEHPIKTIGTIVGIIGLQAIPGVDVAVDIVLIIEFGLDILQTAYSLYEAFKAAGSARTVVDMEHAAAAMGSTIGETAAKLLIWAATWGISKVGKRLKTYREGRDFLKKHGNTPEARDALAKAGGDLEQAESTMARHRDERLAKERAERHRLAKEAEQRRAEERAADEQRRTGKEPKKIEGKEPTKTSVATKGRLWGVDPAMRVADEQAGLIVDGAYVKNPTAKNLKGLVNESGKIGSKEMSGEFMYVVDADGNIIIGTRAGQRMPHPTLIGGPNPRVRAAGIVDIRGGRIYSVNNTSGHFKPGAESLDAAREAFEGQLPKKAFHKEFKGYVEFE